jgi:hypothetical protein
MSFSDVAWQIAALLIYPGLAFLLLAGFLLSRLWDGRFPAVSSLLRRPAGRTARLALFSLSLYAPAMLGLPWPGYVPLSRFAIGWAWLVFEAAAFLPLLPALYDGAPRMVRAAARAAQYGLFGRLLFWALLTIGVSFPVSVEPVPLIGRLLLLAAMLLAYPVAVGRLQAAPEPSLALDPLLYGTDGSPAETALVRLTVAVRDAALLFAALSVTLPLSALPDWIEVLILSAAALTIAGLMRWQQGQIPRAALTAGLRWTLAWVALPAAAAVLMLG